MLKITRPSATEGNRVTLAAIVLPLLVLISAPASYSQKAGAADQDTIRKPATKEYFVTRTVVNSVSGEAIRRAVVEIPGSPYRATLTQFCKRCLPQRTAGLQPGKYWLAGQKSGFRQQGTRWLSDDGRGCGPTSGL
jgi:hypothetical protein